MPGLLCLERRPLAPATIERPRATLGKGTARATGARRRDHPVDRRHGPAAAAQSRQRRQQAAGIGPNGSVEHDRGALADLLLGLAGDPARRAGLGSAARAWVVREHAPAREVDAVEAAYARACTRERKRG